MAQIGDLLIKLNRGEKLQPAEEQELRLWGNQTQINNAYVGGLQNGSSNINASVITGNTLFAGKEQFSGLAGRFINDGATIPNSSLYTVPVAIVIYNDGYPFDGSGTITILTTGYYNITMEVVFNSNASGGQRHVYSTNNHIYLHHYAGANESLTVAGSTDVLLRKGNTMSMIAYQDTGGDLGMLRGSMTIRKIR